jgi:hypothetical protein
VGQERLGPSHFFIPLVLGPLNSLVWYVPSLRYIRVCVLLLQDLLQSCSRGGRRRVEDMCYERRRAEACVDESAHHAHAA